MLTGDKVETAINIGYSAGLLEKSMVTFLIEQVENEDIWAYENEYKTDNDDMDIHNVPMLIISDVPSMQGVKEQYFSTIDIILSFKLSSDPDIFRI